MKLMIALTLLCSFPLFAQNQSPDFIARATLLAGVWTVSKDGVENVRNFGKMEINNEDNYSTYIEKNQDRQNMLLVLKGKEGKTITEFVTDYDKLTSTEFDNNGKLLSLTECSSGNCRVINQEICNKFKKVMEGLDKELLSKCFSVSAQFDEYLNFHEGYDFNIQIDKVKGIVKTGNELKPNIASYISVPQNQVIVPRKKHMTEDFYKVISTSGICQEVEKYFPVEVAKVEEKTGNKTEVIKQY
ncbi:MAG: hypothetical protein ACOYL6_17125 [Bacteriovoracaceae bacterium]